MKRNNFFSLLLLFTGSDKSDVYCYAVRIECAFGQQWKTNEWVIHFETKTTVKRERAWFGPWWMWPFFFVHHFSSKSARKWSSRWFARSWNDAYFKACETICVRRVDRKSRGAHKPLCTGKLRWNSILKCFARKIVNENSFHGISLSGEWNKKKTKIKMMKVPVAIGTWATNRTTNPQMSSNDELQQQQQC